MKFLLTLFLICISLVKQSWCQEDVCLENNSVFYGVVKGAESILSESECKQQMRNLTAAFNKNDIWAVKLYDASGTPSTGLIWGDTFWLGSREQCLSSSHTRKEYAGLDLKPDYQLIDATSVPSFGVDYFVAYIRHHSDYQISIKYKNETKMTLGLCLPSACQPDNIHKILQKYLASNKLNYKHIYNTSLEVLEVKKTEESFNFNEPLTLLLFSVLFVIVSLVTIGTVYDLQLQTNAQFSENINEEKTIAEESITSSKLCWTSWSDDIVKRTERANELGGNMLKKTGEDDDNQSTFAKILLSFSFVRHFNSVFNMSDAKNKLKAINGIRVQTTFIVILGHGSIFILDFVNNRIVGYLLFDKPAYQGLRNSSYTTDSFLCISGFLLAYSFYNSKKDDCESFFGMLLSCFKDIVKRYIRISPTYFLVMLITIVLASWTHKFDTLWNNEREDLICRETWWANLFYINNINPGKNICMYWSHYLSLDLQFFIIATFCLHFSRRYLSTPIIPLTAVILVSVSCLGYTAYIINFKPLPVNFFKFINVMYYPPWMRAGPYMIGAIYGYSYHKMGKQLDLNKTWIVLLWTCVSLLMLFIMVGFRDSNISVPWAIFHACFGRNIWAIFVGWMILACITNHGGILNSFLSAKIWLPLSKLTFGAYLVHPTIIFTMGSFSETSFTVQTFNLLISCSGLIFVSFLLAIPFTCCVELPCIQLYNVLYDRFSQNRTKTLDTPEKTSL